MKKRWRAEGDLSRAVREAREGDLAYLLGDDAERWWAFVGECLEMGSEEVMVRIDIEDDTTGPWFMWLVFEPVDRGTALSLVQVCIPDTDSKPETALTTPLGREQVPYFVLQ